MSVSESGPVKVVTLSSLYPSAARPRYGIFVETRLRRLVESGDLEARVVAPVPWFPFPTERLGEYGRIARTPRIDVRHGIPVDYPRYPLLPRVGMRMQPAAVAWAAGRAFRSIRADGFDFDLIDAHYFYPDGIAAARLAKRFRRPFVVTARGSDINLIAQMPGPRRAIREAAAQAGAIVAVSEALKRALGAIGVDTARVEVLRNGVDLDFFRSEPRAEARSSLGLDAARIIASVGNLVVEKGHDLVLNAASRLDGVHVILLGRGPERERLQGLARTLGMADRTRFLDEMSQDRLRTVYSAADFLALGSSREGWPNVVMEALACGTPVVAFDVGGVREILGQSVAGRIVRTRDAASLATALAAAFASPPDRSAARDCAEQFGWEQVIREQLALYRRVIEDDHRKKAAVKFPTMTAAR